MAGKSGRASSSPRSIESALRRLALAYPQAHEDFPWGERVIKVGRKIFVFLNRDERGLRVTVKLPMSCGAALLAPFAKPTGYGLGRSGWITASFGAGDAIPFDILCSWIDESYRAVAPKKLIATIPAGPSG
ncbi:MAG TPA: MmcQ/YjbR family DNA-binding protein [Gammaproteobacteria bacterium]